MDLGLFTIKDTISYELRNYRYRVGGHARIFYYVTAIFLFPILLSGA